jgi:hypothetical protein
MGKQKVRREKKDVRQAKDELRDDKRSGNNKQVRESKQDLRDEKQEVKKARKRKK